MAKARGRRRRPEQAARQPCIPAHASSAWLACHIGSGKLPCRAYVILGAALQHLRSGCGAPASKLDPTSPRREASLLNLPVIQVVTGFFWPFPALRPICGRLERRFVPILKAARRVPTSPLGRPCPCVRLPAVCTAFRPMPAKPGWYGGPHAGPCFVLSVPMVHRGHWRRGAGVGVPGWHRPKPHWQN